MPHDDPLLARATEWAVRVGDPAFGDWEAFTRWLSESPAHAEAYDRVVVAVADAAAAEQAEPVPANDEPALAPRRTRRWVGGAIAASLTAILALGVWQLRDDRYTVETAPGEVRTVALGNAGTVELAGGTRIMLNPDDSRFASLEEGQALFTVHHDAAHPFTVHIGDATVVDVGTVFDIRRDSSGVTVAVAEGQVNAAPNGADFYAPLKRGQMASWNTTSGDFKTSDIPAEQVGEWREGRITFRQDSLVEIADRLTRATGISYTAATGRPGQTYSGSVLVAPLRAEPQSLGPLLGVKVVPAGKGWVIEAP